MTQAQAAVGACVPACVCTVLCVPSGCSDTHAEMLALGLQMRKHTTAKALVDAR
jgi:hypothetical protein